MIEKVVTTNGFTFTYTPSLKVLGVTSPNGKLEIFHQIEEQKANEKVGEILEKHRDNAIFREMYLNKTLLNDTNESSIETLH